MILAVPLIVITRIVCDHLEHPYSKTLMRLLAGNVFEVRSYSRFALLEITCDGQGLPTPVAFRVYFVHNSLSLCFLSSCVCLHGHMDVAKISKLRFRVRDPEEEVDAQNRRCGEAVESRTHIVSECKRYEEETRHTKGGGQDVNESGMESFGASGSIGKSWLY